MVQEALVEASQGGNLQPVAVAAVAPEDLVVVAALDQVWEAVVLVVLAALVVAQAQVPSMAGMMTTPMMTPTNKGRQANLPRDQSLHWPGKNLEGQLHTVASTSVQE